MRLLPSAAWLLFGLLLVSGTASIHADDAQRGKLRDRLMERKEPLQSGEQVLAPGQHSFTLRHGGLKRKYLVHIPARAQSAANPPVVLALHGGGGSMDYMAGDFHYGLISKSEAAGFIAVFPNGTSAIPGDKLASWNAGKCCAYARDHNIDDVGFISTLIDDLALRTRIDRARVFSIGMSNGAMMSYRLACELPHKIRAIMAVAGTDNTLACAPGKPTPILHIHAKNDDHVLFDGGAGPSSVRKKHVTDYTSVPATMEKWRAHNGCQSGPTKALEKAGAYCELHSSCRDGAEVKLCVTESGGHSWPGGHKPRGDEPPSKAISANDLMWEFFSAH